MSTWTDLCDPDEQTLRAALQEVDIIATLDTFVTVRKTPEGHMACNIDATRDAAQRSSDMVGMWLHSLIDDIAERFLDVVDTFDEQIDLEDDVTLFPARVELHFADTYDKLLRASDGLDLARDLLAGVRDFHQAEIANNQNEVTKRLTAITSLLLVPTFIVGKRWI